VERICDRVEPPNRARLQEVCRALRELADALQREGAPRAQ